MITKKPKEVWIIDNWNYGAEVYDYDFLPKHSQGAVLYREVLPDEQTEIERLKVELKKLGEDKNSNDQDYLELSSKNNKLIKEIEQLKAENKKWKIDYFSASESAAKTIKLHRDNIIERDNQIKTLKNERDEYRDALEELVDLMQDTIDGEYEPDSFTLQVARKVLEKWSKK